MTTTLEQGEPLTAWQKWRMCGRKKDYRTRAKAVKFGGHRNLRAYECPVCFCWHLTSKPPKEMEQMNLFKSEPRT